MAQKKRPVQTHYLVTENYLMTRSAALHFPTKQFASMITSDNTVYGVVVDLPMNPKVLATLVVYINGAVNLYFNNGGSYTGASQRYPGLVQAGRALMANAPRILGEAEKTKQFALPTDRSHHIYLLTKKGIYQKVIMPTEMIGESKDVQAVYVLYQRVMQEIRTAQLKDRVAEQTQQTNKE